jgi:Uncharacterized conserved protein (DUF2285)
VNRRYFRRPPFFAGTSFSRTGPPAPNPARPAEGHHQLQPSRPVRGRAAARADNGEHYDHDKRRLIGARRPHHNELRERFGVELPSAPCEQKPAHFMADSISCVPNDGAEVQRISLGKNQIAVILDLDRPGNSQLKKASKAFKSEQHRREQTGELKLKGARARVEKYITYLRILDAYEAGAEAKNIAGVLFPTLRDEHPSYARRKRLDDDRRAALELRDGGYLSLLRK